MLHDASHWISVKLAIVEASTVWLKFLDQLAILPVLILFSAQKGKRVNAYARRGNLSNQHDQIWFMIYMSVWPDRHLGSCAFVRHTLALFTYVRVGPTLDSKKKQKKTWREVVSVSAPPPCLAFLSFKKLLPRPDTKYETLTLVS